MAAKFRNKVGQFKACRVRRFFETDDPMNDYVPGDVLSDIANDLRKRDIREGCPRCRAEVEENASEPDVMQRWGLR